MENKSFGPHLTLDLSQCNKEKLRNLEFIFNLLNELPKIIGMTPIIQPYVFPYSGLNPEDKGITGILIIAESHISIHTFIEKDYIFIDVFSCKYFDVEKTKNYFIDAFESKKISANVVERGLDFPR
jgi:S-adenosylmethionine decarboxylase